MKPGSFPRKSSNRDSQGVLEIQSPSPPALIIGNHGADSVVYIEKVESPQVIRYSAELGEQRPLHCTAIGMAVFAYLAPALRDELLRNIRPRKFTARTST